MTMEPLTHSLERSLLIRAPREVVFRYFTDPERFARWWGEGSTIEPKVGGEVRIQYPGGVVMKGEVLALRQDASIAFTYGYENSHPELPPGSSRVTITLTEDAAGTLVKLVHELPSEKMRDAHVPGWRYHMAVFANVVANDHHEGAAATVDRWFEAWAEADVERRSELLEACATEDVSVNDPYACFAGRDELVGHITNTQVHMPGIVMQRDGDVRHCQGTLLFAWVAKAPDGTQVAQGSSVARLAPDGRVEGVTGFAG